MENRVRKEQLKIRLSEEEKNKIYEKFKLSGEKNLRDFIYKMTMQGYILKFDLTEILEVTTSINKVGNNINQIVKNANITKNINDKKIEELKNLLEDINKKQDEILSNIYPK